MNQSESKKNGEKHISLSAKKTAMVHDNSISNRDETMKMLKERIELECGHEVKTPKDYDFLAIQVYQKTHFNISVSTLKRFMGYLHAHTHTSASTLDILSRYVGFLDFEDFQHSISSSTNEANKMSKQELIQHLQHLRLQATYLCEQIIRLEELLQ